MTTPAPPPISVLLGVTRRAARITLTEAAKAAGISKGWLSAIEHGHDNRDGEIKPANPKAEVVAALAAFYGLSPERVEAEGERPDAALVLREIIRQRTAKPEDAAPVQGAEPKRPHYADPQLDRAARRLATEVAGMSTEGLEEAITIIQLILENRRRANGENEHRSA